MVRIGEIIFAAAEGWCIVETADFRSVGRFQMPRAEADPEADEAEADADPDSDERRGPLEMMGVACAGTDAHEARVRALAARKDPVPWSRSLPSGRPGKQRAPRAAVVIRSPDAPTRFVASSPEAQLAM
jgi:hypothetical protein